MKYRVEKSYQILERTPVVHDLTSNKSNGKAIQRGDGTMAGVFPDS